jgi:hypothetical protein
VTICSLSVPAISGTSYELHFVPVPVIRLF